MGEITYTRTAALSSIADRIRQRVKSATTDIIAIGKDLIAAKAHKPAVVQRIAEAKAQPKPVAATRGREKTPEEKERDYARNNLAERLRAIIIVWSREFPTLPVQDIASDALADILDRVQNGAVELGT